MSKEIKCLRCGSDNLKPANFESTGKIYSRPKDARLVSVFTTGILVEAILCLDCGHIELLVDAHKARSISKESCTPILMLIWNFLTGIVTPSKPEKDESPGGTESEEPAPTEKVPAGART
jgi:predicted nucleic-acid-binding Zn-ribbon protein